MPNALAATTEIDFACKAAEIWLPMQKEIVPQMHKASPSIPVPVQLCPAISGQNISAIPVTPSSAPMTTFKLGVFLANTATITRLMTEASEKTTDKSPEIR